LLDESLDELVAGGGLRYAVEVGETDGAWGGFALGWSNKAVSALKIFEEGAHCWVSVIEVGLDQCSRVEGMKKAVRCL
jgi:hypothetical protein